MFNTKYKKTSQNNVTTNLVNYNKTMKSNFSNIYNFVSNLFLLVTITKLKINLFIPKKQKDKFINYIKYSY